MRSVAIIGGGPSGICSAKYSVQNGLLPTVFDLNDTPGGLWIPNSIIWSTLYCNFTRYSMLFSDFPWPDNSDFFYPHRDQMLEYLQNYIKHFNLIQYFQLNTRVISAKQTKDSKWILSYEKVNSNDKNIFEKEFDYLIVASGFNSIPNEPIIENQENFKGIIMHSITYKVNDEHLKNKKVLVVGSSNSSVEITSDLVGFSKSVINIFNRPFWAIPKFIETKNNNNNGNVLIPRDFLFYTREFVNCKDDKYEKYSKICPEQTNKETAVPELYIDSNYKLPVNFGVSQHYYRLVKEGKIKPIQSKIKNYTNNGVELENGEIIEVDVVLYCTGFKLNLPFFDEDILNKLNYDKNNYKNPIVLYKHTFHPQVKNAAFIFLTRGGFFTGIELQSKWASLVLSGKKELPTIEILNETIQKNIEKRKTVHPSVQFPHGLYVEVVDELAKEVDVFPNDVENDSDSNLPLKFQKYLVQPSNYIYKEDRETFVHSLDIAEKITNYGVKPDANC